MEKNSELTQLLNKEKTPNRYTYLIHFYSKQFKLEIDKDKHRYTICIIKDDKKSDGSVNYKMYKQRRSEKDLSTKTTENSLKILEAIDYIDGIRQKYKRLKELKVKNDEV